MFTGTWNLMCGRTTVKVNCHLTANGSKALTDGVNYGNIKSPECEIIIDITTHEACPVLTEMQKAEYMVFAGRQYFLGDKCQVMHAQPASTVTYVSCLSCDGLLLSSAVVAPQIFLLGVAEFSRFEK